MKMLRRLNILTLGLAVYTAGLAVYQVPFAWIVVLAAIGGLLKRKTSQLSAHGTGRFAYLHEVKHMLHGQGLPIGTIEGKLNYWDGIKSLFQRGLPASVAVTSFLQSFQGKLAKKPQHLLRLVNSVHTVIFGPTGSGKGTCLIIPFLRKCTDACVILDFKGENYRLTSAERRKLGQTVIRIDPFNVCGPGGDTWNPMEPIDPNSDTAIDECRAMGEALVVRTGKESDRYWDDSAEIFLASLLAATVAFALGAHRNLQSVRTALADPEKRMAIIELMCKSPKWEGMLSRLGHSLKNYQSKTLDSVLTAVNRHMNWADTIAIANNIRQSSFDAVGLLKGTMSIYIIVPPEHIRTQAAYLRLIIGSLIRVVIKGGLQQTNKVHFVIDEANSLGFWEIISDILAIGRGYGVSLQLYYQDRGQLAKSWPDGADQSLLANTSQVYLPIQDPKTATDVSTQIGDRTILVSSGGTSTGDSYSSSQQGGSSSRSTSSNSNWSQIAQRVLKPEQILSQLPPRTAITFTPGVAPIITTLHPYFEKSSRSSRQKGLFMATAETVCLFVLVAAIAVAFTMGCFPNISEVLDVQGGTGFFRPGEEWGGSGTSQGSRASRDARRTQHP